MVWGYYSASASPTLRVRSGDTVEIETVITNSPARLEAAGLASDQIEPALRAIYKEVTDKGPGGHILTGPIYIEGAETGDTLEVRIQAIRLDIPYAHNGFRPGSGFLPDEFPYSRMKIVPLDRDRMVAHFSDRVDIPLWLFFGSMGVAPPFHAGNLWSRARRPTSRCKRAPCKWINGSAGTPGDREPIVGI